MRTNYEPIKAMLLQKKIAESRFALPVTAVYAVAMWLAGGLVARQQYAEFAIFALSAYLMAEMNNRNALIRVYSRMVSCSFIVFGTMTAFALNLQTSASLDTWLVQLCFIAAYLTIFSCYQDKRAQGKMFYAFMFIGVASIMFVQALFFVPLLWLLIGTNLMAFSERNFWASLIGLTVPYWFYGGYCALTGQIEYITAHFAPGVWVTPLFEGADLLKPNAIATIAFIAVCALIGITHFMRNSYKDKIRTRMIYETLITMTVFCLVFMILQPRHFANLTGILTIHAAVLTGHFIALTNTKLTNITFYVLTAAGLAITAASLASL